MIFGQVTPRSPKSRQWWAPWVYVVVFGALAGAMTYGSIAFEVPARREWSVLSLLWFLFAAVLLQAFVVTVRHLRKS